MNTSAAVPRFMRSHPPRLALALWLGVLVGLLAGWAPPVSSPPPACLCADQDLVTVRWRP